ncbi:MAG: lipid-A-disaccharide synthase [Candidatus Magnetomorum sp.]|nr:lipid-A-disaccharide synthase [Candidatus Magnetomorum sp.]
MTRTIMITAGEASGDAHGGRLVNAIHSRDKTIRFIGVGGDQMKQAGVNLYVHLKDLSVVGITEVFSKRGGIFSGLSTAKKMLREMQPDLLILIDFPDFNLIVAKTAKNLRIPVLYYVSPQIWAWRSGRVKKIKRLVDHMAVILPFEVDFYRKYQVPATYVGNPLLDHSAIPKDDAAQVKNTKTIGLLPGSRDGEIQNLLPIMAQAADRLAGTYDNIQFLIPRAPTIQRHQIQDILDQFPGTNVPCFSIVDTEARHVHYQSDLVIVASGTATLEAALTETPMIIIYRISPASYFLGKFLIDVPHIGLANLVAGQRVVPELIQDDATPEKIYQTACQLLDNPEQLLKIRRKLKLIRQRLGGPGASQRTADIAFQLLKQRKK